MSYYYPPRRATRRAPAPVRRRAPKQVVYRQAAPVRRQPRYNRARRQPVSRGEASLARSVLKTLAPYAPAAGAGIGAGIGTFFGGPPGTALGSAIGFGAGKAFSQIAGSGDYKVSVNSVMAPLESGQVPEFQSVSNRCTVIKHREFIGDVVTGGLVSSASTFTINTFPIQPGNSTSFPWLSGVAQLYEQYQVRGMVFEYKTTSGVISSNQALGTVILATQYNSLSPVFTNKQEMENYEFAVSTVPSASVIHPIECDPKQTQCGGIFNILSNDQIFGGDKRLYDLGDFSIATVGCPVGNTPVGELWVSYDICFLKPRLNPSSGSRADNYFSNGVGFNGTTNYFGFNTLSAGSDGYTTASGTTITFTPGFYGEVQILWLFTGSGTQASPAVPTLNGSNGVTGLNLISATGGAAFAVTNTNGLDMMGVWYFTVAPLSNGSIPTITFSGGAFPGTPTSVQVFIIQLPSDFS